MGPVPSLLGGPRREAFMLHPTRASARRRRAPRPAQQLRAVLQPAADPDARLPEVTPAAPPKTPLYRWTLALHW